MKATFVHRPAPRGMVMAAMILLALVVLPGIVLAPERSLAGGNIVGVGIFVLFEWVLLTFVRRRVEVFINGAEVRLVSVRWPLASREERIALARIRGVEMEYRPRGRSVRLVLRLDDQSVLPLTHSYFGHSFRTDEDLKTLRTLFNVSP